MKTSTIVLLVALVAIGGGAFYWFAIRKRAPALPPPKGNPLASGQFAPPVLPPKIQPQGSPSPLANLENQAINFGFGALQKIWT